VRAVSPAPDGGYGNANTAEGDDALFSLTTGTNNTAIGFDALLSNTTGESNTATGVGALFSNTTSNDNTANGAEVDYYDPYVPVIKPSREHSHLVGKKSVEWNRSAIASFDLVLIATNHACVNYKELGEWAQCIVDTRNAMAGVAVTRAKVWKA
jgi:hypothetical protein